jgi:hypothetical protein
MRAVLFAVLASAAVVVALPSPTRAASVSFAIDLTLSQDGFPFDREPGLNGDFPGAGSFTVDEAVLFGAGDGFVSFDQVDNFSLMVPSFSVHQELLDAGDCSIDERSTNCGIAFSGSQPLGVVGFFRTPTTSGRFLELANLGPDPFDPASGFQRATIVVPIDGIAFDPIASGSVAFRRVTAPMPEPSSVAGLAVGGGLLAFAARRWARRPRRQTDAAASK